MGQPAPAAYPLHLTPPSLQLHAEPGNQLSNSLFRSSNGAGGAEMVEPHSSRAALGLSQASKSDEGEHWAWGLGPCYNLLSQERSRPGCAGNCKMCSRDSAFQTPLLRLAVPEDSSYALPLPQEMCACWVAPL
eukprot:scaffold217244_cov17-Tisochrysis_lutea.AAC.1